MKGKRIFLAQLMLGLFLVYFVGISLFSHSHVINGVTIVHSHPFSKQNDQTADKSHSDNELIIIASLSDYLSPDLPASVIVSEPINTISKLVVSRLVEYYGQLSWAIPGLRGPPTN